MPRAPSSRISAARSTRPSASGSASTSTPSGHAGIARAGGDDQRVAAGQHLAPSAGVSPCRSTTIAPRLPRRRDRAHGELRVVLPHGADAGEDRAGARAPAMAVGARGLAGDPLALAVRERRAAVEARRDLHAHPRPAARHARDEADVQLARFVGQQPDVDGDPGARAAARAPCAAAGLGSAIAATTRPTPAAITASVHGGVRPVWLQGSSVT